MNGQMISKGEKVFVITRRLFDGDLRRHFVGEVQEAINFAMRVQGYSFVFDEGMKQFVRREEPRIRIFSLIDAGLVINILPEHACIEDMQYRWDEQNRRMLSAEKSFSLNISEFTAQR